MCFDESFFLSAGKLLEVPFPAHGFFFGIKLLVIDELYGKSWLCVLGTFSCVVSLYSFFEVIGVAAVVGTVGAFQNIRVMFHKLIIAQRKMRHVL